MKRSGFKPKQQLTPAQLQVKAELALWKQKQRANNSLAQPKRRNKYNARACYYDGIRFPSQLQCEHYKEYRLLEKAGEISDYDYEVEFDLIVAGIKVGVARVDHLYHEISTSYEVIGETKSVATEKDPLFRLKWKILQALYPQYVFELRIGDRIRRTFPKRDQEIEDYQRGAA